MPLRLPANSLTLDSPHRLDADEELQSDAAKRAERCFVRKKASFQYKPIA